MSNKQIFSGLGKSRKVVTGCWPASDCAGLCMTEISIQSETYSYYSSKWVAASAPNIDLFFKWGSPMKQIVAKITFNSSHFEKVCVVKLIHAIDFF